MSDISELINQVHHMSALDLLARLPDASVDCVVTSPPYDNLRTYNGYSFEFEPIAHETYRVLKPGGVCVWVVGDATVNGSETLTSMRQALYFVDVCGFRMHDTMIYQKDGEQPQLPYVRYGQRWEYMFVMSKEQPAVTNIILTPKTGKVTYSSTRRQVDGSTTKKVVREGGGTIGNIWRIATGYMKTTSDKECYEHPAMFPEELSRRHIETWTQPGEIVLDYFGGTGTTAKMARQHGRDYITCDISAEYCDIMRKRLAMPYTPLFPIFLT